MKFKDNVNDGGAGIGLSYCKRLSEIIQADLNFDSIEGVGTNFSLTIHNNYQPDLLDSDESVSFDDLDVIDNNSFNFNELMIDDDDEIYSVKTTLYSLN